MDLLFYTEGGFHSTLNLYESIRFPVQARTGDSRKRLASTSSGWGNLNCSRERERETAGGGDGEEEVGKVGG